jgi:HlyD family secretion protein
MQLNVAEANVHTLEQKLHDRFSKPEIGHAEARLTEARAALAAASDVLRNLNVVAPFAGMAYNLPAKKDEFVAAGDMLVQVADLHRVRVRAFVDEPDIGRLQKGQTVEVAWDALPGRVWRGTVDSLPTNVVQRGTRMVGEVTCILDNADLKLLPNTNVAVAVIQVRHENALTVPREAVRQDADGKYVFEIVKGELKRRNVQTSVANLTRVEITSGIPDGAVLALGAVNLQPLRDGMPVKTPTQ